MRISLQKLLSAFLACLFVITMSGVFAVWTFYAPIEPQSLGVGVQLNEFNYDPGEILYISDISRHSSTNFSTQLNYSKSLPTFVTVKGGVERGGSTVTYKVTVFNNTDVTYWYVGQKLPDYGDNELISANIVSVVTKENPNDSSNTFNSNDWVPARTKRDFYVTYTFGMASIGAIDLMVNFYFSIRIDGVEDEFLKILNDKETTNGYYYLADVFNDQYAEDGSLVIDNVAEEKVFDRLFGGDLTIDVNGVPTPVTVVVQRKDMDGKATGDDYTGNGPQNCEYTVYVTTDTLTAGQPATVYAISYSCGADGVWYKLGQLYEGTASVVSTPSGPMVSVDSWQANRATYTVYDGPQNDLYYNTGYQYGNEYELLKTMEQLMTTQDIEFFNKIDNTYLFKTVYDIINSPENINSEAPEVVNLRNAFDACKPFYKIHNNGQEIKFNRDANITRAEILPYLVKLCEALDYYYVIRG